MKARVRVKSGNFRGDSGWILSGTDGRGRRLSVFFNDRAPAQRTADKYRADPDFQMGLDDFLTDEELGHAAL